MSLPSMAVVIPTRERSLPLAHCLKTCVTQNYQNLEIIVSDNCSKDGTDELVRSFDDPRIRYINTGKRVCMANNWEFAHEHVQADYVTYLGDDDGLLPNSVSDVAAVLAETKSEALCWETASYFWPDHIIEPWQSRLWFCLDESLERRESNFFRERILNFDIPYVQGISPYSGFVLRRRMEQIKELTGRVFHGQCPDVFSAVALTKEIKSYLYSKRPFSISGVSGYSNGALVVYSHLSGSKADIFQDENKDEMPHSFRPVTGSATANILDTFRALDERIFNQTLRINYEKGFERIRLEVRKFTGDHYRKAFHEYCAAAADLQVKADLKDEGPCQAALNRIKEAKRHGFWKPDHFSLDAARLGIKNVADACEYLGKLLPFYQMPKIKEVGPISKQDKQEDSQNYFLGGLLKRILKS